MDIVFVEEKKVDLKGFTLIEGFPGLGLVGTIGVKYLVERLKFEPIGHIESDFFIPIIRIHNGLPVFPSRIYINKRKKLAALVSEQIIPRQMIGPIAKEVVKWAQKKGIKKLISIEGIRTKGADNGGEKKVYGIACNEKSKQDLEKFNVPIVGEGITTGVTSMILLEMSKQEKIVAYSLLGNVKIAADYKAAAECLKTLDEILGRQFNINVQPLLKEAKETEKALLAHLNKLKETEATVKRFQQGVPMYT